MAAPSAEEAKQRPKPPLHNFAFPQDLSWGAQRVLRCMKHSPSSPPSPPLNQSRPSPSSVLPSPPGPSTRAVRSKKSPEKKQCDNSSGEEEAAAAAALRPWNLRKRRAACRAPAVVVEERRGVGSNYGSGNGGRVVKERRKFAMGLTREEIETDFLSLLGTRPPRRPKKRPRAVQTQLDLLFPGWGLREVTVDTYKVPDVPEC